MLSTIPEISAERLAPFTATMLPTECSPGCHCVSAALIVATVCVWLPKPARNLAIMKFLNAPKPNTPPNRMPTTISMTIIRIVVVRAVLIMPQSSWNNAAPGGRTTPAMPPAAAERLVECRRIGKARRIGFYFCDRRVLVGGLGRQHRGKGLPAQAE